MLSSILLTFLLQHPGATVTDLRRYRPDVQARNITSTLFQMYAQGLVRREGRPYRYYVTERH